MTTRVGYTGGTKANPTYRNLGDHTEAFQVVYDPKRISYADLLALFWKSHNPARRAYSRQYRAAIFVHDETQRKAALGTLSEVANRIGKTVLTPILPLERFYRAEDYHQKYYLRGDRRLASAFLRLYPEGKAFADATATARVNAALAGYGSPEAFDRALAGLDLPEGAKARLRRLRARLK